MDEFPEFPGADVRIVLTTGRQYQLHASILRNGSPLMQQLLREDRAANLSSRAVKAGASTRWKLVLTPSDEEDIENGAQPFELSAVDLNDRGTELRGREMRVIVENENGRVPNPIFKAFDALLAALYSRPISLGDAQDDNMADLLKTALEIVEVADYMGCIRIITGPIEATLLATGQSVYRAIAENPTGWLSFSNRIQSRAIFKEALIHAVGMYNTDKVQGAIHEGSMADEIVSIVERKAQEVVNGVSTTMRRLASYYPVGLTRVATVGRIDKDNTGRADYGNDILGWMALSAFRHWLGDMMAKDHTTHAKDMGFFFINLINQGGGAYLNRTLMQQQFHLRFPMSAKGMNAVEFRLTEIKDNVKSYVKPYFRPTCQLDLHRYPQNHYTHINVAAEDYPWAAAQKAASKAAIDRAMYGTGDDEENEDEDEETFEDEETYDDDNNGAMDGVDYSEDHQENHEEDYEVDYDQDFQEHYQGPSFSHSGPGHGAPVERGSEEDFQQIYGENYKRADSVERGSEDDFKNIYGENYKPSGN